MSGCVYLRLFNVQIRFREPTTGPYREQSNRLRSAYWSEVSLAGSSCSPGHVTPTEDLTKFSSIGFVTSPPRPSTACKQRVKWCTEKLGGRAPFQTACQNSKPLRRRCGKTFERSPSIPVNPLWTDRGASPARRRCGNLIGCGRDCTARLAHTPRTRPACPACYSVCVLESRVCDSAWQQISSTETVQTLRHTPRHHPRPR